MGGLGQAKRATTNAAEQASRAKQAASARCLRSVSGLPNYHKT